MENLLVEVGLEPTYKTRYPHEFSGGQRQRIGIARALTLNPKLIVADEPVSALDVSVQAQVMNLLMDLQEKHSLTYLFISHDLAIVRHISSCVAVMYSGKIVETGNCDSIFNDPKHPYTKCLLSAVPVPDPKTKQTRLRLPGDVPSPMNPPSGCRFHTRCKYCHDLCKREQPELKELSNDHFVACHMAAKHPDY